MNKQVIASLAVIMIAIISISLYFNENGTTTSTGSWKEVIIEGTGTSKIVGINLEGPILGSEENNMVLSMLDYILNDPLIKGVVLRINSPGGNVVISDIINQKILDIKETGRLVVVSMGAMATSGGYYISASADKIFANPSTITGSIGVVMSFPNYKKLSERIGIDEILITSGSYKSMGHPLDDFSEDSRQIYQEIVDESFEQFIEVIVSGRNMDRKEVLAIADGRVYSGKQAKELGLIDELGDLQDAVNYSREVLNIPDAKIIRLTNNISIRNILNPNNRSQLIKHGMNEFEVENYESTPKLQYFLK